MDWHETLATGLFKKGVQVTSEPMRRKRSWSVHARQWLECPSGDKGAGEKHHHYSSGSKWGHVNINAQCTRSRLSCRSHRPSTCNLSPQSIGSLRYDVAPPLPSVAMQPLSPPSVVLWLSPSPHRLLLSLSRAAGWFFSLIPGHLGPRGHTGFRNVAPFPFPSPCSSEVLEPTL